MKKLSSYFVYAMCAVAIAFSVGSFSKINAMEAPGQPVDLTYAAEKALPAVVHIKYLQNSKIQTVDVQGDPFGDFFDPFGFFGNPGGNGGTRKRQMQTPKKEGSGSGVIISTDGYIVTNNHVVEGADELTVTLNDNKERSGDTNTDTPTPTHTHPQPHPPTPTNTQTHTHTHTHRHPTRRVVSSQIRSSMRWVLNPPMLQRKRQVSLIHTSILPPSNPMLAPPQAHTLLSRRKLLMAIQCKHGRGCADSKPQPSQTKTMLAYEI